MSDTPPQSKLELDHSLEHWYDYLIERGGRSIDTTDDQDPEFFLLVKAALAQWWLEEQTVEPMAIRFEVFGESMIGAFTIDQDFVRSLLWVLAQHHGMRPDEWRFHIGRGEDQVIR